MLHFHSTTYLSIFCCSFLWILDSFSQVSKLGFGCMSLTGAYSSPLSEEDGIAVIKHAFSKGITFFDSADIYGPHTNEILLGKVINTNFNSTFLLAQEVKCFNSYQVVNLKMVTDVEISLWYYFLYHLLEHWLIIEGQVKILCNYLKEVYIFQALKQLPREKIQIATKFGIQTREYPNIKVNGSPEYVRSSCEATPYSFKPPIRKRILHVSQWVCFKEVGPVIMDPQVLLSAKTIFKLGPTILFTHLKIILLQYFQFSVFSNKQYPNRS